LGFFTEVLSLVIPDEIVAEFEQPPEQTHVGQRWREFCVPAGVVNRYDFVLFDPATLPRTGPAVDTHRRRPWPVR
jgi:hypothetical protein